MCIICKDWEKGKMTNREALRAIGEVGMSDPSQVAHLLELSDKIISKEVPDPSNSNAELDEEWERKNRGSY
jgi:hypothetical protein